MMLIGSKYSKNWLIALALVLVSGLSISYLNNEAEFPGLPDQVDFNYDIRPILSQNCYVCHGPDPSSRKANLRLDIFEGATAKLESGNRAIVPGKPGSSSIMDRITSHDPDVSMPPPEQKKVLNAKEIALINKWIKQGAKWKPHWSLMMPDFPKLPSSIKNSSPSIIIDHYINEKINLQGLSPSPFANEKTLLRRVSYLLTGLPPNQQEFLDFTADTSENKFEKMVDYYLSSPHFGERWARHWMDLVRYAEFMGHEFDYPIGGAWLYRDYLIRAFNNDVPYNDFIIEHLAGDMMPNPRVDSIKGINESLLGTTFFYLGEGKHSPVSIKQEEADRIDNIIDVTSKTFLGLTVSCAKCHDHKFDPIPTTDYYAMYGMIESTRIGPRSIKATYLQKDKLAEIEKINKSLKSNVAQDLLQKSKQLTEKELKNIEAFFSKSQSDQDSAIHSAIAKNESFDILGDFRNGNWNDWKTTGIAFGESPNEAMPIIDGTSNKITGFLEGAASSKKYGKGLLGALRSPNFIIDSDKIKVKASGVNGTIRIIVDNFQLIQDPLYGNLEKVIDNPEWDNYYFNVSMLKGHKAYVEIIPGSYNKHLYAIKNSDFIEVQYVAAFDSISPNLDVNDDNDNLKFTSVNIEKSINDWQNNKIKKDQIRILNTWLKSNNGIDLTSQSKDKIIERSKIVSTLYDSTFVIGMCEGEAVFSPVFIRGNVNQPSEQKIPHQFLHALSHIEGGLPQSGSSRLAWAEAVANPNNPLTSRVIVNRLWQHIFGEGIVSSVDNFGLQGTLPSHPELLDYLSIEFVEEGWSIKKMLKNILLTDAFKRSTESLAENLAIDPKNISLHHFPTQRLESEAIRDGILAVSGSLDPRLYGQSIPIYLDDFMTGRGKPKKSGPLDGESRRSIYTVIRRNFLSPMMLAFDMPIPFSTFGKRNTTNVPSQSLTLMNDPFVYDQAFKWAKRIIEIKEASFEDRINDIFECAFSRTPSQDEIVEAGEIMKTIAQKYNKTWTDMVDDPLLWADYCHIIYNTKEFIYLL